MPIEIVLFDQEEAGLVGSEAFVQGFMDAVHRESIRRQTMTDPAEVLPEPSGSQDNGSEGLVG